MNKYLICGLGAIGQRHVRMIQAATHGRAEIAALRTRNLQIVISDDLTALSDVDPINHYGISSFSNAKDAFNWRPDAVFITNPISLHIEYALLAAKAGAHIFIEKPLSSSLEHVNELAKIVSERRLVCMLGYQQRYHPGYQDLHKLLHNHELGRFVSADLHFGEWLPGMHPYEDYRDSHASQSNQGGGVITCLSHMTDLAYWLFGYPKTVYALGGHLSSLSLDVEDTADILFGYQLEGRHHPVHIHLDFLQRSKRIYTHVICDRGSLLLDFATNTLTIMRDCGRQVQMTYPGFKRNDMFLAQIHAFIQSCENPSHPYNSLDEGIQVLKMSLGAKASLNSLEAVQLS